jgi:hypothetical protein
VNDSVTYLDKTVLDYATPGNKVGLGTDGTLVRSQEPIHGVAVLDTLGDWALLILRVRLGPTMSPVEAAVLRLNRECMKQHSC